MQILVRLVTTKSRFFWESTKILEETKSARIARLAASASAVHTFMIFRTVLPMIVPDEDEQKYFRAFANLASFYHRYTLEQHVNFEKGRGCNVQRCKSSSTYSVEDSIQKLFSMIGAT